MNSCFSDPKEISVKPHAKWGHASARQLRRVLVGLGEETVGSINVEDGAIPRCGVCRALDKTSNLPIAGTTSAPPLYEKLQVELPFLVGILALRAMDMYSKYSLLMPVRAGNPSEARGASRSSWIAICGRSQCIRMDEGGGWGNEVRTDLCAGRRL